jgi:hypothetical protein
MPENLTTDSSLIDRIFSLGHAFRASKALLSATELGLFTVLAEGPLDRDHLTTRLGIAERGARDFFDALVALGLLQRDEAGRYSNVPEADLYLDQRKPTYVGGELEHYSRYVYSHWSRLTEALKTGQPQSGERAAGHYPALYRDPAALAGFARGMTGGTLPVAAALAEKFPWRDYRSLVDLGTAQGALPVTIAKAHPHLLAGGFDLPPLQPLFEAYANEHGLSERVRFLPGDFLADALPSADVLVFGRVLHNWDLQTKRLLLQKAHDALPAGGALLVYERLIDDERRTNAAAMLASLNMLVMTAGGFDFTGRDCIGWLHDAGFSGMRVEPLTAELAMIVASK